MSGRVLLVIFAFESFLIRTHAATCKPHAITLPFKGQTLTTQAETRGVSWEVGSPRQNLSFVLCAAHADTYVYTSVASCGDKTAAACLTSRGGFYNYSVSSSAGPGDYSEHPDESIASNRASDNVVLSDNATLRHFDFSLLGDQLHEFRPQGELGVASGSTFIRDLQAAEKISSRSYSLFWGDEFTDSPRDGSVVFGGYDNSLIDDSQTVKKAFDRSVDNCDEGMLVKLTAMRLSEESGAVSDIFRGLGPLDACIVPSMRNIIALPDKYGDKIIKGMRAKRADDHDGQRSNGRFKGILANTAVITPESATFRGNLSITIEDAVTINFTTQQLLFDDHYVDSNGLVQANTSLKNVPIVVEWPPLITRLGGMFFSSAYLMVNHDKNEFTIAPARTTVLKPDLVGVDTVNDCVAWLNGTEKISTSPTSTITALSSNTFLPEHPHSSSPALPYSDPGLSHNILTAIIVCAIVGVAGVVGVSFFVWRRQKRSNPSKHQLLAAEMNESEMFEVSTDASKYEAEPNCKGLAIELDGGYRPTELR